MSSISRDEYEIEVLASCSTNSEPGSQHNRPVEPNLLWSYAQEEALVAVSEQGPDKIWRLITDPERRAKRIAARYADLYFKSGEKSRGKLQLYWVALAAFVVKDIVAAYKYSRENVLAGGIGNSLRTSSISKAASTIVSKASPYEHALRVYAALAKGNLWLFMDIYPWMWFILEYGIRPDGSINDSLLSDHVKKRQTSTLQQQSKCAVTELPFNANWLSRLTGRQASDAMYAEARSFFDAPPAWSSIDGGYGAFASQAARAHQHVRKEIKNYDHGYRLPPAVYWSKFEEPFFVLEEERKEMTRVANDSGALSRLKQIAEFRATSHIESAYKCLLIGASARTAEERFSSQKSELENIAQHEQLKVLQGLIYDDQLLVETMALNHSFARRWGSVVAQPYTLIFSASSTVDDSALEVTFDEPTGLWDRMKGAKKVFTDPVDRMEYVDKIAHAFNELMSDQRSYMEGELQKIRAWIHA